MGRVERLIRKRRRRELARLEEERERVDRANMEEKARQSARRRVEEDAIRRQQDARQRAIRVEIKKLLAHLRRAFEQSEWQNFEIVRVRHGFSIAARRVFEGDSEIVEEEFWKPPTFSNIHGAGLAYGEYQPGYVGAPYEIPGRNCRAKVERRVEIWVDKRGRLIRAVWRSRPTSARERAGVRISVDQLDGQILERVAENLRLLASSRE